MKPICHHPPARFAVAGLRFLKLCPLLLLLLALPGVVRGEAMLQLFNQTWNELTDKMPELAEAGYTSLWLPPPTKGGSGYSVGYDLFDPFDLGDLNQRGTVRTRYGTKAELLRMVETAHRFGIRVYFDNIVNHRAFDVPGYNANTPTNLYPGMVPQDFHIHVTSDGYFRNVDGIRDYNSTWQVQNLSLSGLLDIAHENPNANFGRTEGSTTPKLSLVRQPTHPEYYYQHPTLGYVGFGGLTLSNLNANPDFYREDVNAYLIRSARWLLDTTKCDGFRLDAVKHAPDYFFGQQSGANRDSSDAGYVGGIQRQFNITHGFNDSNHRDSNFDTETARDDALVFGEHLGEPPGFGGYTDAGMRLLDNPLRNVLNNTLGNPGSSLAGLEQRDFGGFSAGVRVMHAQSHDSDYAARRELQNAFYFFREGVPLVYSDGYNEADTCDSCGGAFPRHANMPYLGQFSDNKMPDLAWLHGNLARGGTRGRWGDSDVVAFERYDYREAGSAADQTVVLFAMNDNFGFPGDVSFDDGVGNQTGGTFYECFPVENSRNQGLVVGFPPGSVLVQLADSPGKDRACSKLLVRLATNVRQDAINSQNDANPVNRKVYVGSQALAPGGGAIEFKLPGGGYVAYGYEPPQPSRAAWHDVITFRQGGAEAARLVVRRQDGKDGDSGFNPRYPALRRGSYNPDGSLRRGTNVTTRTYAMDVPIVTNANFDIEVRTDASTDNVLVKLDGGMDVNSHQGSGPSTGFDRRDNKPGASIDVFLGFEQARFIVRRGPEKFGSTNIANNTVKSYGAETFSFTIGGGSNVVVGAGGGADVDTQTADWVFHNPIRSVTVNGAPATQRNPIAPTAAQAVDIWFKIGNEFDVNRWKVYYTTDGSNPEGSFGTGVGTTRVADGAFAGEDNQDGTIDWAKATIPAQPNGTVVKYKVSVYDSGISSISDAEEAKESGITQFSITNFNPQTATVWLHNNLNTNHTRTGLAEGFHMVRARAFLGRDGKSSVYNTYMQTFYYDAQPPDGVIAFPAADGQNLGSREYGVVVRADATTTEVEYNIQDSDANNDDVNTGQGNGNGLTNGQPSWVKATLVAANQGISAQYPNLPLEYRFTYLAVPASGSATIAVRFKEVTTSILTNRFRTLTRTVNTLAPAQTLEIAFPASGQNIALDQAAAYTIVARFTDTLTTDINLFTVFIDGAPQPRTRLDGVPLYRFQDQTGGDGKNELRFDWSGMSAGQHVIEVEFNGSGLNLQASRIVNVSLTGAGATIVAPPAVDLQGRSPFTVILPLKTNLMPADRSYTIVVSTPVSVTNVLVSFSPTNAAFPGGAAVLDTNFVSGSTRQWLFAWTNMIEGLFTLRADAFSAGFVTATQQVRVAFRLPDADGDGLPDEWELQYGLDGQSVNGLDGSSGDPDGDGFTNLEEYLAGTNPNDAASLLKVTAQAGGGRSITWQSAPGKVYQILAVTNLAEPFVLLGTNIPSTGATTTFVDPAPAGTVKFYRVSIVSQ